MGGSVREGDGSGGGGAGLLRGVGMGMIRQRCDIKRYGAGRAQLSSFDPSPLADVRYLVCSHTSMPHTDSLDSANGTEQCIIFQIFLH